MADKWDKERPSKLRPQEYAALRGWQRRMVIYFSLIMLGTAILLPIGLTVGFSRKVELILTIAWTALLMSGVFLQFSIKCPRCGARIGFQSRLLLPRRCTRCGVGFKEGRP